jgi:hypothetical protein
MAIAGDPLTREAFGCLRQPDERAYRAGRDRARGVARKTKCTFVRRARGNARDERGTIRCLFGGNALSDTPGLGTEPAVQMDEATQARVKTVRN